MNVDIVLPCYNPLPNWEQRVVKAFRAIDEDLTEVKLHLYIVNDGSTQHITTDSINYIKNNIPTFQYITYDNNQGKGYALRQGVLATKNDICIYTDIDFPYQKASFLAIFDALKSGIDVAIGVREARYYENVPKIRVWISKSLKWMIRNFLRLPVTDTQCGLKGFNKNGKQLFLQTTINRYLFDLEFIFLTSKRKEINLKPVIVELRPNIVFSNMNFKILAQEGRSFLKIFLKSWF